MANKQRSESIGGREPRQFADLAERAGGVTRAVSTLGLGLGKDASRELSTQVRVAVIEAALEEPGWGAVRAAKELQRQGIAVSSGHVRDVLDRYALNKAKNRWQAKQRIDLIAGESDSTDVDETVAPLSTLTVIEAFMLGVFGAAVLLRYLF